MAVKRPSFLKRQKEQKRAARAQAKRDARREKKEAKYAQPAADQPVEDSSTEQPAYPEPQGQDR